MIFFKAYYPVSRIIKIFTSLIKLVSNKRKIQLYYLFFLMTISGFAEMISIAVVVPFLNALTNPNSLNTFITFPKKIILTDNSQSLFIITLFFIGLIITSTFIKILTNFFTLKLSAIIGNELSTKAYNKIIYQPFKYHTNINSNKLIVASTTQTNSTVTAIEFILQAIFALLIVLFLTIQILQISIVLSFSSILIILFLYLFFWKISSKELSELSLIKNKTSKEIIRVLSESMAAIQEIILAGNQKVSTKNFGKLDYKFRIARANSNFIQFSPKYIIEAIGIILISCYGYLSFKVSGDSSIFIPKIGAFALAAQKLIQAFQVIYACWSGIKSNYNDISDVIELVNLKVPSSIDKSLSEEFGLKQKITIKNLSYRYNKNSPWILQEVNFIIKKGDFVGISGKTGQGKSTLMNILMSLLEPTTGQILVDDDKLFNKNNKQNLNKWRSLIALVPQDIFLLDDTIKNNIIFSENKADIDFKRLKKACKIAAIDEFINLLPLKLNTPVGEKGIKLSGGQKQRIGIARAIYKNSEILFLDEATSALDKETEKRILDAILLESNLKTIFMITHRLSTLRYCNKLIEIKNKKVLINQ